MIQAQTKNIKKSKLKTTFKPMIALDKNRNFYTCACKTNFVLVLYTSIYNSSKHQPNIYSYMYVHLNQWKLYNRFIHHQQWWWYMAVYILYIQLVTSALDHMATWAYFISWPLVFNQLFQSCNIRGYGGKTDDPIDTAYRIVADHTRMASVCIADGLLPGTRDQGYRLVY